MALLKYKNQNGEYVSLPVYTVNSPQVVQDTGDSTTAVMSQNAVTLVVLNLPDNEDLMIEEDKLKLADRVYNPEEFSGKGYKILRKNIVEGKNILTLEMVNEPNTVYEIRYDFDLNGITIIIPNNCILNFQGGNITNGVITLNKSISVINSNNNTLFIGNHYKAGLFSDKPDNPIIGFSYFCTDKHSLSDSENGIMIYYSGENWVDSNGIVVDDNYPLLTSGTTELRPTSVNSGYLYFDTTINKPIWKTSSGWVDATGTNV